MRSLLAVLVFSASVAAENPLSVKIISEVKAVVPGQNFMVGLYLKPPPGFHYWKHLGIVGLATSVEWTLPPGFSAGEIQ